MLTAKIAVLKYDLLVLVSTTYMDFIIGFIQL